MVVLLLQRGRLGVRLSAVRYRKLGRALLEKEKRAAVTLRKTTKLARTTAEFVHVTHHRLTCVPHSLVLTIT